MFKAGTQQEQEDFRSASPSPPPLPIVIDQAAIVPTPFDQSQRAPFGSAVDQKGILVPSPPLLPITNNVIPKPATQERPDIIKYFINKPCNIGSDFEQDTSMYNMLRDEATRHRDALWRARGQIPSNLKKSWNNYNEGDKMTEITLFEYKVYRMFKLPIHLCEDHWVANFLLRKASLVREAKESMNTTSVMSGVSGQAVASPGQSLSIRSVASKMSIDSVAQEAFDESSAPRSPQYMP
ncbi:hypothetical protein INT45_000060, partial [Circinella minor]